MFAGLATFAASKWGALTMKAMMVMTIIALIYVAVSNYNESIRSTERMANQNAQLEQVIKENKEFRLKLDELDEKSDQILINVGKKNQAVSERHTEVTRYITSPEGQASNRESSEVLKNTVRMLNDE